MVSHPTMSRKLLAGAMIIVGFGLTVAVKLIRNHTGIPGPVWIANALPNFICGAVLPLAVFMSQRTIRLFDFSLFAGFILIGLGLYEAAQIWMPKRTAEWIDVQASAVGTSTVWKRPKPKTEDRWTLRRCCLILPAEKERRFRLKSRWLMSPS